MEGSSSSSNTENVEIIKKDIEEQDQQEDVDVTMELFDLNYPPPEINEEQRNKENADTLNEFDLNYPQPEINEEQREKEAADALIELLKGFDLYNQELQINEESERLSKRTRTAESTTNVHEADGTEWGVDPLEITEKIVLKYRDFVQEMYQLLKDEEKDREPMKDEGKEVKIQWRKWKEILERANLLVESLNEGLETVAMGMEWMKSVEELKEEYSIREKHVLDLVALLRNINARIESSPHFRVVSDLKNRNEVLKLCLQELEKSKEELTEMVNVIQELKGMDHLQQDDDDDDEAT